MPNQQEFRLGQHIGEYRLIRKLGGGGFGTVYLAEHVRAHTPVAVKVLSTPLTRSEDFRHFINEARTIRLHHPHIVPLLDFGLNRDDRPFLVMEYASEGALRDRHPKGERIPLSTIVSYVEQIASALQYAHDHRIIHRDVKPENILVRADGTLLISDFGIATLLEQSTLVSPQARVGTPVYMAPEQHSGHSCFASDQYALAIMIYEWICGVRPFEGTGLGMVFQHINTPPPSLIDHVPMLPEAAERVVLRALAKDPEDRFACIQDFADALREAVQPSLSMGVPSPPKEVTNTFKGKFFDEPASQDAGDPEKVTWHLSAHQAASLHMAPKKSTYEEAINVAPPKPLHRRRSRRRVLLLVVYLVLLVSGSIIWFGFSKHTPNMAVLRTDGIGVTSVDQEDIGISDGRYALDTDPNRVNKDAVALKIKASESLRNGNVDDALAKWNQAYEKDTRDAESLIYAENQRVLKSGSPYITIVLGVSLGVKVPDGFSRDTLQGAYIAQKECNENPQLYGGKKLRLLIARSGSNPSRSEDIAKQIVQAAQFDKTIVGVQGWTNSVTTLNAMKIFAGARLPVVGGDTASDELTGISRYFFRIGEPNGASTGLNTTYIEKQLAAQRVVIFKDPNETFSSSFSNDLVSQFTKDNYVIPVVEEFKTADKVGLAQQVQNALKTYKPDLLCITTNTVGDVETVLNTIPPTAEYANLKVFTGGAGYELFQSGAKPNGYARLLFSVSSFPDVWSILAPGSQEPHFFNDYRATYDPDNQHPGVYGYSRANSEVMMDYDALSAFLVASKIAVQQGKQNPTSEDIRNALSQIHGSQAFQGITGAISFGPDGNPVDKTHIVIRVTEGGLNHVAAYQGCFLVGSECDDTVHILE